MSDSSSDEAGQPEGGAPADDSAIELARTVLVEEARRQATQEERDARVVLPNDLLPGVGDEPMGLKEAIRAGGPSMVAMMFMLNVIDDLPRAVRVLSLIHI